MRFFIIAALLFIPSVALAQEASKPPKPVVCFAYSVLSKAEAVCRDGKPFVMTVFQEVELPGKESGRVKVLVGWR